MLTAEDQEIIRRLIREVIKEATPMIVEAVVVRLRIAENEELDAEVEGRLKTSAQLKEESRAFTKQQRQLKKEVRKKALARGIAIELFNLQSETLNAEVDARNKTSTQIKAEYREKYPRRKRIKT